MSSRGDGCGRRRWEFLKRSEIIRQRVPETRTELRKERSENLSLGERDGTKRQRWSEERVLPVGLIVIRSRRLFGSDNGRDCE